MGEKRTLLETFLPVEEISAEAKKEKLGRAKPPTSELHYWWTRKPLIAARAVILAASLPADFNIENYKRLLSLNKNKRSHNYDIKISELESLKKEYFKVWSSESPTILDPFAGGGSIPFEALRTGFNVISNDYNPIANLIQKATFLYPAKYREKLINDVEIALKWIFERSKNELIDLYPKHQNKNVAAYIYAWAVNCPDCGYKSPLVGSWSLVSKKKKKIFLNPIMTNDKFNVEIKKEGKIPAGNVIRGKAKCLKCGKTISHEHIKKEINEKEEETLLAVALLGKKGKEYVLPNEEDFNGINNSKKIFEKEFDNLLKDDLISIEEMPDEFRGSIWSKPYLKYWYRLLNPRQRLVFASLITGVREYLKQMNEDAEYIQAIATYLSFFLGNHITRNCRSTTWDGSTETIAHALARRGIPIMWDHAETNPFIKTSGSLIGNMERILKSIDYSIEKLGSETNSVTILNESITNLNTHVDIVITDPPYFDDVVYAELSEFFYVIEKRALKNVVELPNEIPKSEDLSVGGIRKKEFFEHLFNISCEKINSILSNNGIFVIFFAHSNIKAWEFVVNALQLAGFRITATWPIHTESTNNPLAKGKASILSSIIIVARKREKEEIGYIEEINNELEVYLKNKLTDFWKYGLRGADITVAAMGATLDIITQYSEIKSYSGEMTVTDILELTEVHVVRYILDKFLKDSESLDSVTRFYVYCRLSELDGMSFDTANLISKSLNIDLKELESTGIIEIISKGKKKGIKLLIFEEREFINIRNLIDAVHASMLAYNRGGVREFENLLNDIQYSPSDIYNVLSAFQHLESDDPERQVSLQILGKTDDIRANQGETTLDNIMKR